MRYQYKYEEAEFLAKFGSILEIDKDSHQWQYGTCDHLPVRRRTQAHDGLQHVYVENLLDCMLLLDYLSTKDSRWDSGPELSIEFPDGSKLGFQARGNCTHIPHLQLGDTVILTESLLYYIDRDLPVGHHAKFQRPIPEKPSFWQRLRKLIINK